MAHVPPDIPGPRLTTFKQILYFDNPFIVNYIVYHHYRSLGWVIKGGIKFCVDYLLYKRGPVFSHAEYVVVILHHLISFMFFVGQICGGSLSSVRGPSGPGNVAL